LLIIIMFMHINVQYDFHFKWCSIKNCTIGSISGATVLRFQTIELFGRLNNNMKRSKNNKSPKLCLGDLISRLILQPVWLFDMSTEKKTDWGYQMSNQKPLIKEWRQHTIVKKERGYISIYKKLTAEQYEPH
jgi:hypothetical protein